MAALSTSIDGVIIGRALQGGGAVGSVILALVADLTAEDNRTKAMALVGVTIGGSFMVALVAGPIVASFVGVAGIFWLMVALALVGIAITQFVVPNPPRLRVHRDAEAVPAMIGAVLRDRELLRLDFGIFALHAMLTASFLVVPGLLRGTLDVPVGKQWMVYLPVLLRLGRGDGAGDHRRREISPHERRLRRCGGGAVGEPGDALCRRR